MGEGEERTDARCRALLELLAKFIFLLLELLLLKLFIEAMLVPLRAQYPQSVIHELDLHVQRKGNHAERSSDARE